MRCAPYESTKDTHFEHPWVLQVRPRSFLTLARSARSHLHRSRGGMENRAESVLRHSRAVACAAGCGLQASSESSSESRQIGLGLAILSIANRHIRPRLAMDGIIFATRPGPTGSHLPLKSGMPAGICPAVESQNSSFIGHEPRRRASTTLPAYATRSGSATLCQGRGEDSGCGPEC